MAEQRTSRFDSEKLEDTRVVESRHSNAAVSQKGALPRRNQRTKEKSSVARACSWVVDHQISISVTLQTTLALTHTLYPSLRPHTRKFFSISYYNAATGTYALGWDDILFVFFWIVVFTGLRCIFMDYILAPLGESLGLKKKKAKTRFVEQAWILIYYTLSFSTGMYIMYNSDYWLNLRALWTNWPVREMDGLSKWYYLIQFAFYLQQIVVVNIEERRKDHWQMFTHHLITCALIFGSYGYHFSKVGTLIMCLMDVVDLFLPLAKILKYLHYSTACDIAFGVFMVVWFAARHIFYMWTLWSTFTHTHQEMNFGCYKGSIADLTGPVPAPDGWKHVVEPFMDPVGTVCFNQNILNVFLALLVALQVILLIWFVMIVRVAYKVITGHGAEDVRSDDEESEEDEIPEDDEDGVILSPESRALLEKEILTNDPEFSATQPKTRSTTASRSPMGRSVRRKGDGHSSGVNLLAASDRKELLGRIGCDKGVDQ